MNLYTGRRPCSEVSERMQGRRLRSFRGVRGVVVEGRAREARHQALRSQLGSAIGG